MIDSQEITKAIGAHGAWKRRLETVIKDGRSDVPPERVAPDNHCDFGKWLYSLSLADQNSAQFKKVQALHATFHKEAANVIRTALSGNVAAAGKSMVGGGAYYTVSMDLTGAMMDWKKALGG